jgi:hypothetical protein
MSPDPRTEPLAPTSQSTPPSPPPSTPPPTGAPTSDASLDLSMSPEVEVETAPLAVPAERALAIAGKLSGIVHGLAEASRRYQKLQDAHTEAGEAIPGDWSPAAARNATRSFTQAGEYLDDAVATLEDALRAAQRLPDLADSPAASPGPASPAPRASEPGARGADGPEARRSASTRDPRAHPGPPRPRDSSGPELAL